MRSLLVIQLFVIAMSASAQARSTIEHHSCSLKIVNETYLETEGADALLLKKGYHLSNDDDALILRVEDESRDSLERKFVNFIFPLKEGEQWQYENEVFLFRLKLLEEGQELFKTRKHRLNSFLGDLRYVPPFNRAFRKLPYCVIK